MNNRRVLVLRDKRGRIHEIAKYAYRQAQLKKWFERYNIEERLETLLATRKLKEHVRLTKQRIRKRGFTYQMSFYGIWKKPNESEIGYAREYRRYEVFKATPWKPDEVALIHDFLKTHVPKSRAGLFIFHDNRLFVEEKDELTKFGRNKPKRTV